MPSTPSRTKKYGQSCLICRRRKVRCDGGRPSCANCLRIGEGCIYNTHDSTVTRLQNALSRSEQRLLQLESDLQGLMQLEPGERHRALSTLTVGLKARRDAGHHGAQARSGSADDMTIDEALSLSESHHHGQVSLQKDDEGTDEEENEEGYGATSRFYVDEDESTADRERRPDCDDPAQVDYHKRWLTSNARFHKSFEEMAYAGLQNDSNIDADTAGILLKIYWTWQAPLHNCVYRRSFFRDMVLKGPYFSEFLLYVIYAHASRHIQPSDTRYATLLQGEPFLARAKQLLLDEFKKDRPAIPTIQGLLILGGRQCALGRNSEGWLYTGMAIRMIKDLGLHLPRRLRLANTEPDDLETQKRLYLSAYTWDKSISLCLGRPPSLITMLYPPHCLFDNTDDDELWEPFYLGGLGSVYAPTPCYNTTTFSHFVKLSTIVNDAFKSVFGSRSRRIVLSRLRHMEEKLYEFFRGLPPELQMGETVENSRYLPPHIFCLNILYHTMHILIYRPYFVRKKDARRSRGDHDEDALLERATIVCTREAMAVNRIFQAYGRCFANKRQTYLLSYCVYTAATVEVKQVGDEDPAISQAAVERLATTLTMLEEEARQTPGIRRSIDIIRMRLRQESLPAADTTATASSHQILIPSSHMETFPSADLRNLSGPMLADVSEWDPSANNNLFGSHQASVTEHGRNLQPSEATLQQLPFQEDSLDLWNMSMSDVGGGFVQDSLSWYANVD